MLHFRTLDWTMDPLRKILVQLEFVRTSSATPGQIIARSITYVGFIGVLDRCQRRLEHGPSISAQYTRPTPEPNT